MDEIYREAIKGATVDKPWRLPYRIRVRID